MKTLICIKQLAYLKFCYLTNFNHLNVHVRLYVTQEQMYVVQVLIYIYIVQEGFYVVQVRIYAVQVSTYMYVVLVFANTQ